MKTETKQTSRTGTESEKWISHAGMSVGRGEGWRGIKGRKKWNNSSGIFNKMYFLKKNYNNENSIFSQLSLVEHILI